MVSSTPRPHFTPGKDPVPILQEAEWAPGPVWTGRKSRPHRDSIPDRPARSQSLYRLSYPAHPLILSSAIIWDEWSNSHPWCSTPAEITVSGWVGLGARLDLLGKECPLSRADNQTTNYPARTAVSGTCNFYE